MAPSTTAPEAPLFLIVGGVYVDELHEVSTFPREDTACRALSYVRRRGGNAGNLAFVLRQLVAAQSPGVRGTKSST